jgi:hypothetical protein
MKNAMVVLLGESALLGESPGDLSADGSVKNHLSGQPTFPERHHALIQRLRESQLVPPARRSVWRDSMEFFSMPALTVCNIMANTGVI